MIPDGKRFMETEKTYIHLQLFATLGRFAPDSSERYPIFPGTTMKELLDKIGIPVDQAKLIFINGVRGELTSELFGGERVGIFPPVGGG